MAASGPTASRMRASISPSGSVLPVDTIAPWLATYTASSGRLASSRDAIASTVAAKKAWSTGPHGGQSVTMAGTGSQGPVASRVRTAAAISVVMTEAGRRASARIASPSK